MNKALGWSHVRDKVYAVNAAFATLIDALDPGKKFLLSVERYPYGMLIPSNTMSALILKNNIELFFEQSHSTLPYALYSPGKLFGFERDEPQHSSLISMSAGARSVFMLPTIGDASFHQHLQRAYNLKSPAPTILQDHWRVFSEIAAHPRSGCDWETEVLYFSDIWLDKLRRDKAWGELARFVYEQSRLMQAQQRNQLFYEILLARVQRKRNLRPNAYLADTAKHLLNIALGHAPAFSPALDESNAPIKTLQRAFVEDYGVKYCPTIMQPAYFSGGPLYYSLQYPTALVSSPKVRVSSSTLMEMRELKHIVSTVFGELRLDQSVAGLAEVASRVKFDFFHSKVDSHAEIKLTAELGECDVGFKRSIFSEEFQAPFAESAPFLRGCVRMSFD